MLYVPSIRHVHPVDCLQRFNLITLEALNKAEEGATVNFETLFKAGE